MTGEAGFPGFKASQVRWVSFLQSRLRRQFDSAVLAEPADTRFPGPNQWFAV